MCGVFRQFQALGLDPEVGVELGRNIKYLQVLYIWFVYPWHFPHYLLAVGFLDEKKIKLRNRCLLACFPYYLGYSNQREIYLCWRFILQTLTTQYFMEYFERVIAFLLCIVLEGPGRTIWWKLRSRFWLCVKKILVNESSYH